MQKNMSDLKTAGFVIVPYPPELRRAVEKATNSWKAFCALPLEVKKGLPYSNNADGVGYEYKDGIGPRADRKENFDLTVSGKEWLAKHASEVQSPVALAYIEHAAALVELMKPVIVAFTEMIESEYFIEGFVDEVRASEFFVRFIHYFENRTVGDETATAHVDQSGFTFHLFESAPGLECLTKDRKWIPMPVSDGETVVIPSMQLQLRSKGELEALFHRVVATPETATTGRYSAVCFIQLKHTPKYDKDTHGRLQEKEPGFNYGMPPEQFAKFFKK